MKPFRSLNWSSAGTRLPLPPDLPEARDLEGPAVNVLQDFTHRTPGRMPAATEAQRAKVVLEVAEHHWNCVVGGAGELVGVITLRDLLSRHSAQRASQLQLNWGEVPVRYLMTPLAALPVVEIEQLRRARIGDIAETLHRSGCDFLVVGASGDGPDHVHGIISSWTLAERLGRPVEVERHPASFAEIVQAVRHPDDAAG